jgi:hypothetical protein
VRSACLPRRARQRRRNPAMMRHSVARRVVIVAAPSCHKITSSQRIPQRISNSTGLKHCLIANETN